MIAWWGAVTPQGTLESVRSALSSEDYRGAWEITESEEDPVLRARERAEIYYRAGDPGRALQTARLGLMDGPGHLDLLYYAAGSAIWLGDGALAEGTTEQLRRAVDESAQLSVREREQWNAATRDFQARCEDIQRHERERKRAITCSRLLAIGGLLLGAVLVLVTGRRTQRPG